jgi:hypothetical protein
VHVDADGLQAFGSCAAAMAGCINVQQLLRSSLAAALTARRQGGSILGSGSQGVLVF